MRTGLYAVNGMQMFCEIRGEGFPLVLLHGFTGSSQDWKLIYPIPPEGYRLIAPDLRGHGRSTNPIGEFTHRQAALDAYALLDEMGIGEFDAIGMSAGGNALLHMATQQPGRPRAMILVSATTHFPEQARAIMAGAPIENRSKAEWEAMRKVHHYGDEQIKALWRQINAFKDSSEDMNFTSEALSGIKARTLIVHGDRDFLYPDDIARELARGIKDSRLWIVPGGGHVPIFGAASLKFREVASDFFADRPLAIGTESP